MAWPLFIPAIIDGIKSSQSNKELDRDYSEKSVEQVLIKPGSFQKTVVFIPKHDFKPLFNIDLIDQKTGEKTTVNVSAFQ